MRSFRLNSVPLIKQSTDMSCWYASVSMVAKSYLEGPTNLFGKDDTERKTTYENGLSNGDYGRLADSYGLSRMDRSERDLFEGARRESRPGVTFEGLVYMLNAYGPLWTVIRQDTHAVVVIGAEEDSDKKVWVLYNDPADGCEHKMPLKTFNTSVQWRTEGVMLHQPHGGGTPHFYAAVPIGVDGKKPDLD